MPEENTIIPSRPDNISDLLRQDFDPKGFVEALTGLVPLLLSKEGLVKVAGSTLQGLFRGNYVAQVSRAWEELKEKGRIANDQFTLETISEMANFLDEMKVADEERFKVAQKFFCECCRNDQNDGQRQMARQMLILTKELSSEEIRILNACYLIASDPEEPKNGGLDAWATSIAKKLGHDLKYLVTRYEDHLVTLGLLGKRVHSDLSGIRYEKTGRLTDLGLRYCEILSRE